VQIYFIVKGVKIKTKRQHVAVGSMKVRKKSSLRVLFFVNFCCEEELNSKLEQNKTFFN